jgi:hypothetical protein
VTAENNSRPDDRPLISRASISITRTRWFQYCSYQCITSVRVL